MLSAWIAIPSPAVASEFPGYINYQGKLGDPSGNPLSGTYSFRFRFYSQATGGTLLATDANFNGANAVLVSNGLYSVQIGSLTAGGLSEQVFLSPETWLEIDVNAGVNYTGAETLAPRERLAASPFAFRAVNAEKLGTGVAIGTFTAAGNLTLPYGVTAGSGAFTNAIVSSTLTVQGNAFSVGNTTLVVTGGNIGFGTNTPHLFGSALPLPGRVMNIYTDDDYASLVMRGDVSPIIWFENGTASAGRRIFAQSYDNNTLDWSVLNEGTGAVAQHRVMALSNTGRVGISTGSPQTTLEVNGSASFGAGAVKSTFSTAGVLTFPAGYTPTNPLDAATKDYVDTGGIPAEISLSTINATTTTDYGGVVVSTHLLISGGLRFPGTSVDGFTTPIGSVVPTKINAPLYNPGAYGQVLAMGLPSSAPDTARVMLAIDARTVAHQPTLLTLSPNEQQGVGFTFDGDDNSSYLKSSVGMVIRLGGLITGTDVMSFKPTGMIGVGTTSQAARLHVSSANALAAENVFLVSSGTAAGQELFVVKGDGKIGFGTDTPTEAFVVDTSHLGNPGGTIVLGNNAGWGDAVRFGVSGRLSSSNSLFRFLAESGVPLTLENGDGAGGYVERLRIAPTGQLGIGTSAPSARLHVSSANAVAANTVFFVSSGTAAGQELLAVKGDGKVGIGTAQPATKLDVLGDATVSGVIYGTVTFRGARAYVSAAQSIGSGSWTKVELDAETFDTHGEFDSTTNYRYQPTHPGYYQCSGVIELTAAGVEGTTDTEYNVALYKTGTIYSKTLNFTIDSMGAIPVTDVMFLNGSSDYVELYINHSRGANADTATTAPSSHLVCHKLGN